MACLCELELVDVGPPLWQDAFSPVVDVCVWHFILLHIFCCGRTKNIAMVTAQEGDKSGWSARGVEMNHPIRWNCLSLPPVLLQYTGAFKGRSVLDSLPLALALARPHSKYTAQVWHFCFRSVLTLWSVTHVSFDWLSVHGELDV